MRMCSVCGGEITDLYKHSEALLCLSCRKRRMNPKIMTHAKYGDEIRAHLDKIGWPNILHPFSEIKENTGLLLGDGRTVRSRHTIFCQGLSLIEHDECAYRFYSKGSNKSIYKLTKIE